jgi:hypothetical protein
MKRFPTGILLATLLFALPAIPRVFADESAQQLAKQQGLSGNSAPDESAEALAKQNGVADTPGQDPEESAADLAKQNGVAIDPASEQDESARKLAEKEGLEKKSKKVASSAQSVFTGGEGIDGSVFASVALSDGSAIVGGRFTSVNGQPRANLARILADGTLDPKFLAAPNDGVSGAVYALAQDASGNLLVGGFFTSAQGVPAQNFVRYLANGTLDASFNGGQSPNGAVYAIAVQPDGHMVIGGQFSQIGSVPRRNLARYNADGTLDGAVTAANGSTGSVRSVAVLANGAILAGGTFEVPGQSGHNLLLQPQP